jgi:hypothetical protein
MRTAAAFVTSIVLAPCLSLSASPQNIDAMAKWASAKVIHYHVVGAFTGRVQVLKEKDAIAFARVSDRVAMDFDWDQTQQKTTGDPVFTNFPTMVESIENTAGCPPVKVNGSFEYFTFQSARVNAVMFELHGMRNRPAGSIPIPGEVERSTCGVVQTATASEQVTARMQLALAMILAMPAAAGEMKVSPDGKSVIQTINTDGWIWTMTPTIVR